MAVLQRRREILLYCNYEDNDAISERERERERVGLMSGWLKDYSYKCQPIDYSDNPIALRVRTVLTSTCKHCQPTRRWDN
uniref:Uncharacterized protein n=1 Tax=Timema monikensis TaxID=170555 RepID=A0A7R9HTE1_9NEOP|nr:unnamed protein product [Timema monikensis]